MTLTMTLADEITKEGEARIHAFIMR